MKPTIIIATILATIIVSNNIQAQTALDPQPISKKDPERFTIEFNNGQKMGFASKENYDQFLSEYENNPLQTVSIVVRNSEALIDKSAPLTLVMKTQMMVPKDIYFVAEEPTAEAKAYEQQQRAEAKAKGQGFFTIRTKEKKVAIRKYVGTLALPDPVRSGNSIEGSASQSVAVFENGLGDLEIWTTAGHRMRLEKKFIEPSRLVALKKDLETNKEDPRKATFRMNESGDIFDTKSGEIIAKADAYNARIVKGGLLVALTGDHVYNRPIESDVSAEDIVKRLEGLKGHVQVTVKTAEGTTQILHINRDKNSAKDNRDSLDFYQDSDR